MRTSLLYVTLVELFALASADKRWDNGTAWSTEVVTAYTTYCPSPTVVVQNNQTYVVTSATLLTITNCPCTISTMVPLGSSVAAVPTTVPTPVTTAIGGGVGGGGGGGATTSAASSSTSGFVQSSNAGAVAGSFFGTIIAVGIMAGLM